MSNTHPITEAQRIRLASIYSEICAVADLAEELQQWPMATLLTAIETRLLGLIDELGGARHEAV